MIFASGLGLRLIIAGVALLAAFLGGVKLENMRWNAKEAARLEAAIKARQVDESFTQGVSAAYEQVAAQLRRMAAVNRVEIHREVERVEYRCPLPDTGRGLLNRAVDSANRMFLGESVPSAGPSEPDAAVRSDPASDSERPRGTGTGIFGTDGDLR